MAEQKTTKKDFVEINFLGRNLQTNEVFDTNITEEAKKIKIELSGKPLIVSVGAGMVVPGFDEALEDKEVGKKYSIKISAERAFGKRQPDLVRMIPLKVFAQQKIYPQAGMTFALDNNLVKIISVSGGRVMVDFNNPLAGKEVEYEFIINRIISDIREKANALQRFFFEQEFEFEIDDKNKKLIFKDLKLTPILNAFREKFKEFLDMDVEIFAKPEKANSEKKIEKEPEESPEKIGENK